MELKGNPSLSTRSITSEEHDGSLMVQPIEPRTNVVSEVTLYTYGLLMDIVLIVAYSQLSTIITVKSIDCV